MRPQRKTHFLVAIVFLSPLLPVFAEPVSASIGNVKIDVNKPITDNLKRAIGEQVGIIDRKGILYVGVLKQVTDKNVLIEKRHNNENRVTLIRSSNIVGFQVKMRGSDEGEE